MRTLRNNGEKGCLAESVADVRGLLRQMLSDPIPSLYSRKGKMRNGRGNRTFINFEIFVILIDISLNNQFIDHYSMFSYGK